MSTVEPAVLILNSHLTLAQTAELEGAEVHVPEAVIDLLQAHVFADADRGDVDPPAVPPNATVGADVADFEAIGILERWQPVGHRSRRGRVAGRRRLLVERLVRPLLIELLAKDIEAPLLRGEAAGRRPRRLGLQRAMHAFVSPILRRAPGAEW